MTLPNTDLPNTVARVLHPTTPERFQHNYTRTCKEACGYRHWCLGHTNPTDTTERHPCHRPPSRGLQICRTHGAGLPSNREAQRAELQRLADLATDRLEADIADPEVQGGGLLAMRLLEKTVLGKDTRTPLEIALDATRADRTFPDQLVQAIMADPELAEYYRERMSDDTPALE